jgi:UDP-N-acetylglucosamine--N-acetylmuramyl-(pentapeptide) pyrophosphoryl-undecaprenol N-acetylglucosamine transferase
MAGSMMIMAGGTGGHVFPALAVANVMRERGWDIFWLGRRESFEARVVPEAGIAMEWIDIQGLRGKGLLTKLLMPLQLFRAVLQSISVIRRRKPDVVLGMGGFAAGPGGLAAKLTGRPLVIHEQNTIPGMTNQWLSRFAVRVFEAFPNSFAADRGAQCSGNPVRPEMFMVKSITEKLSDYTGRNPRLLIIGGSLGAQAFNELLPAAIKQLNDKSINPEVRHQAGRDKIDAAREAYSRMNVDAEVVPFIDDMQAAYSWADLVVCRSGALTVSELAAAGTPSLLIPFPFAVDDHQTGNGNFLVNAGAAVLFQQKDLNAGKLAEELEVLFADSGRLQAMGEAAKKLSQPIAASIIADACEEVCLC